MLVAKVTSINYYLLSSFCFFSCTLAIYDVILFPCSLTAFLQLKYDDRTKSFQASSSLLFCLCLFDVWLATVIEIEAFT